MLRALRLAPCLESCAPVTRPYSPSSRACNGSVWVLFTGVRQQTSAAISLSSNFPGSRSALLEASDSRVNQPPQASALAGALSGGVVGALTRGRRNVLPGALVFGALGYAGQKAYSYADDLQYKRTTEPTPAEARESLWDRMAKSRWMPLQKMEDAEYERRLQEKLLEIDAELAVLEDDIRSLREQGKK